VRALLVLSDERINRIMAEAAKVIECGLVRVFELQVDGLGVR